MKVEFGPGEQGTPVFDPTSGERVGIEYAEAQMARIEMKRERWERARSAAQTTRDRERAQEWVDHYDDLHTAWWRALPQSKPFVNGVGATGLMAQLKRCRAASCDAYLTKRARFFGGGFCASCLSRFPPDPNTTRLRGGAT